MKLKIKALAIAMLFTSQYAAAQNGEQFKPSGSPTIRIYTNFHNTWTDGESQPAFEIQRAYLGYKHKFSPTLSGQLILDVGDPKVGGLEMTAYLKNAYMQYKNGALTVRAGMIGLYQFKLQEDLWGGRYLYKSFMDEHKFGPSADLGMFAKYDFAEFLSADLTIANGEGYKLVQADSLLKYSGGLTISPVEGLDIRASYDFMGRDSAQQTLAFYTGYESEQVGIGAEYNYQYNHRMIDQHDLTGLSFYGWYQLNRFRFFGRYDHLTSPVLASGTDPWNDGRDGQVIIAGIEYSPVKGIKITPNYQGWINANDDPMEHTAYVSLEIRF